MPLDVARMWHDKGVSNEEVCDECLATSHLSKSCFYCGGVFGATSMRETEPTDDFAEQLCEDCGGEIFRYSCPECFVSQIYPKDELKELAEFGQKFTIDESTDLI